MFDGADRGSVLVNAASGLCLQFGKVSLDKG